MQKLTYKFPMEDMSILQPQVQTSIRGFLEAKNAYENGTAEVRRLLMHECSIIYECSICRNMFRNLNSFITHKRIYCCDFVNDASNGTHGYNDEQHTSMLASSSVVMITNRGASPTAFAVGKTKLETVKEERETAAATINTFDELEEINKNIERLKFDKNVIVTAAELEHEKTAKRKDLANALTTTNKEMLNSEIYTESLTTATAKCQKKSNSTAAIKNSTEGTPNAAEKQLVELPALKTNANECKMCYQHFPCQLSLKKHMQKQHFNAKTMDTVACPVCKRLFYDTSEALRHYNVVHNNSKSAGSENMERFMQKQDKVNKTSLKVASKSPCRELKRLKLLNENAIKEQSELENQKMISKCIYCDKAFERRAALSTHMLNCQPKPAEVMLDLKAKEKEKQHALRIGKKIETNNASTATDEVVVKEEEEEEYMAKLDELFASLDKSTTGTGLQTVCLADEKSEVNEQEQTVDSKNEADYSYAADSTQRDKRMRNIKQIPCICRICNKAFSALSNVRRHISMRHYSSDTFGCTLCDFRGFRRYDIVNHLCHTHKMKGDRIEMSVQFVSERDVKFSKEDMNKDIIVLDGHEAKDAGLEAAAMANGEDFKPILTKSILSSLEKRAKRKRNSEIAVGLLTNVEDQLKVKPSKELRSLSQHLKHSNNSGMGSSAEKLQQKRPIRNRIKAENKDFVYELSSFVNKTDTPLPERENLRSSKRRSLQSYASLLEQGKDIIMGSAQRIALALVNQGLAKASSPPELPAARPQIRPRTATAPRNDSYNVPVIETSEFKAKLFDDSYLDNMAMRKCSSDFRMKPCLAMQHSALSSLMRKVDMSQRPKSNINNNNDVPPNNEQVRDADKEANQHCASTNTTTKELPSNMNAAMESEEETLLLAYSNGNAEKYNQTTPPAAIMQSNKACETPAVPKKRRVSDHCEWQPPRQLSRCSSFLRSALEQ